MTLAIFYVRHLNVFYKMLKTATDETSYKFIRRHGPDGSNSVEPWIWLNGRVKNNDFRVHC
jgi:hypothetical protein